jgi:hypothetical protein
MDFQLGLDKIITFWPITPTTPPHLSLVALFVGSATTVQQGVMLQHDKYILGNYGIRDAKGHLWVWNRKLVMWGR